ncbi:MAG: PD40 domain-containing protein [Gemmatimonadetes bacterium]|nr:PD40 domain-containing protein [Gemmatimonadota bacterium]
MRRSSYVAGPRWIGPLATCVGLVVSGCGGESEIQPAQTEPEGPEVDFIQEAVWSPSGDRLLAAWHQGGRYRLYGVLGPDTTGSALEPGSGLRVSDGPDLWPTWSRDGLWVAFSSSRDGQSEIYRMRPDGMQVERLTDDPAEDAHPAFSPDGRSLAFISDRTDGAPRLHIMDADGSNVRVVGSGPGTGHHAPAWSPDGTRLAVQVTMEDGEYVYLATPAGGWGRVKAGTFPAWAPNGDDIYLTRNDSLLVTRASTGSIRLVLADGFAPRPSPDGRWLAFVRGEWPISALYVLDLETGVERRLTR